MNLHLSLSPAISVGAHRRSSAKRSVLGKGPHLVSFGRRWRFYGLEALVGRVDDAHHGARRPKHHCRVGWLQQQLQPHLHTRARPAGEVSPTAVADEMGAKQGNCEIHRLMHAPVLALSPGCHMLATWRWKALLHIKCRKIDIEVRKRSSACVLASPH